MIWLPSATAPCRSPSEAANAAVFPFRWRHQARRHLREAGRRRTLKRLHQALPITTLAGQGIALAGIDVIEIRTRAVPSTPYAFYEGRRAALELSGRSVPLLLIKLFPRAKRDIQELYPPCASRGATMPRASAFLYILRKTSPDCVAKSRLADFIGGRQLLDGHGAIR